MNRTFIWILSGFIFSIAFPLLADLPELQQPGSELEPDFGKPVKSVSSTVPTSDSDLLPGLKALSAKDYKTAGVIFSNGAS
jgi:hypothetical protein